MVRLVQDLYKWGNSGCEASTRLNCIAYTADHVQNTAKVKLSKRDSGDPFEHPALCEAAPGYALLNLA